MRIGQSLTPFALGMGVALLVGVIVQKAQNFQEQESCYRHYSHSKLEGGPKTHTLIEHRSFFGETYYCLPLHRGHA